MKAAFAATCAFVASSAFAQAPIDPVLADASAAVVEALKVGDAAAVESRFDDTMRHAMPAGGFAAVAAQIDESVGRLQSCGAPTMRSRGFSYVEYRCAFAHGPMTLRLVWVEKPVLQIAGLFVLPLAEAAAPAPLPDGVRSEAITTGAPGWPLPGTVLVPVTSTKPPIVVLIHGSGPNDRDETIGPNKPFQDLAIGLAAHGIASLRYDKRTFALGPRFAADVKNPTLDDEIVDDAVAAIVAASRRPDVGRVFVVGHSEGAWLAPRIARAAAKNGVTVAGVVMLAAPLTPFADLLVDQYVFLASLPDGGMTAEKVDDARRRRDHVVQLVRQARAAPGDPAPLPLDLPASLWRDLGSFDPAAALLAQPSLPALLTFGGRDFQVPIRERGLWQARLADRPDTAIVAFDAMSHLLIDGDGPMAPADYARPGHVSAALIDRVSGWIDAHARR